MLTRRTIIWSIPIASILQVISRVATAGPTDNIAALGLALGDAADAVGKLGDNIAHLVSLGDKGWTVVQARLTKERLTDMSKNLSLLATTQNVKIIASLNDYIQTWNDDAAGGRTVTNPSDIAYLKSQWTTLLNNTLGVLQSVNTLMTRLRKEQSGLVTQGVYRTILEGLGSRNQVLEHLSTTPAPNSYQEIQELKIVSNNYENLRTQLGYAIDKVNLYINSLPTYQ